jgi:hypothetical protein
MVVEVNCEDDTPDTKLYIYTRLAKFQYARKENSWIYFSAVARIRRDTTVLIIRMAKQGARKERRK